MLKRSIMAITASITTLLFLGSPVFGDSQCKGLSQSSCQSNSECVWVDGYKRQDGSSVEAYCRSKPNGEKNGVKKEKKEKRKEGKESKKSEKSEKTEKSKNNKKSEKSGKSDKKKNGKEKSSKSKKNDKGSKKKSDK